MGPKCQRVVGGTSQSALLCRWKTMDPAQQELSADLLMSFFSDCLAWLSRLGKEQLKQSGEWSKEIVWRASRLEASTQDTWR